MKNRSDNKTDIIIAYVFHLIFIILGFLLLHGDSHKMAACAAAGGLIYLIYFSKRYNKGYMPLVVYLNFIVGSAAEVILNLKGVIPTGVSYLGGLDTFLHVVFVTGFTILLGVLNTIKYLKYKLYQGR